MNLEDKIAKIIMELPPAKQELMHLRFNENLTQYEVSLYLNEPQELIEKMEDEILKNIKRNSIEK